jgi:hypothetical protein
LENAKKNLVFHFEVGRHASFPQKPVVKDKFKFSDCSVTITKPFGVITSPLYPQPYRNGIDCTWNIQVSTGQWIQFNFLQFNTPDW